MINVHLSQNQLLNGLMINIPHINKIIVAGALIFIAGCNSSSTASPKQMSINYGESKEIGYSTVKLAFVDISDSRCPVDVVCAWEGNAKVFLEYRSGLNVEPFTLNTSQRYESEVVVGDIRIKLISVTPELTSSGIELSDYKVQLETEIL